jgi:protein-disulfide isomerase
MATARRGLPSFPRILETAVKNWIANAGMAVLVACAVTVTALVVRRELFAPLPAAAADVAVESRTVADWRGYARGDRIGPAAAKVTIVEFADFECPFCRAMAPRVRDIRRKHPREVALVYRHDPLSYHPHAADAAKASVCAGRQGRFEALHDLLYARQDSLGAVPWPRLAAEAGVGDLAAFGACMRDPATQTRIDGDVRDAARLGVKGTPTFLVNDRMMSGAAPGALEAAVERALASDG